MSKYKGQRDYEREIEEAAKRMKKYPEHLKAAKDSEDWINFLDDIGVKTVGVEIKSSGKDFWEEVRQKVVVRETGFEERRLIEARVTSFSRVSPKGKEYVQYRSTETGRFVSRKSVENA